MQHPPCSLPGPERAPRWVPQGTCPIPTPFQTAGPFYTNFNLVRRDITDGEAGLAIGALIRVVDADCVPVPGAVVDLWHNNPEGAYSGYASQGTAGESFLRGIQVTNSAGIARFRTIFPGWYPGRTTHMHVKVRIQGVEVLTTQTYFPDNVPSWVYANFAPYDARGQRDRTNRTDVIFAPENVMSVWAQGRQRWCGVTLTV